MSIFDYVYTLQDSHFSFICNFMFFETQNFISKTNKSNKHTEMIS